MVLQLGRATTRTRSRCFVGTLVAVVVAATRVCAGSTVYVDVHATGASTGECWADAMSDLQAALACAASSGGSVTEIWAAQGTYTPATPESPNARSATFRLCNDLALYGGFRGGELHRDERDPHRYRTVLSGDLLHDDQLICGQPGLQFMIDNSYHVVTGSATGRTAVLDGFTVCSGSPDRYSSGGGAHLFPGATIRNCVFEHNQQVAVTAGGDLTLSACIFRRNGGGLYTGGQTPEILNCLFAGNKGRAVYIQTGACIITNCTLYGNEEEGIFSYDADGLRITNCILWANARDRVQNEQVAGTIRMGAINYCCIQDNTGIWGGIGNTSTDPRFVDPPGQDGITGTPDDDMRLRPESPCIDAGDNSVLTGSGPLDLAGFPRFVQNCFTASTSSGPDIVDLGALEYQNNLDTDGFIDCLDNCPWHSNEDQADNDGDDIGDACDACSNTPTGVPADAAGCPMGNPGDFDGDGDVDQQDFGQFQLCLSGSQVPQTAPRCRFAHLDADTDVDVADTTVFSRCMSGADVAADPNCAK